MSDGWYDYACEKCFKPVDIEKTYEYCQIYEEYWDDERKKIHGTCRSCKRVNLCFSCDNQICLPCEVNKLKKTISILKKKK
jgi:hypothetical protein